MHVDAGRLDVGVDDADAIAGPGDEHGELAVVFDLPVPPRNECVEMIFAKCRLSTELAAVDYATYSGDNQRNFDLSRLLPRASASAATLPAIRRNNSPLAI